MKLIKPIFLPVLAVICAAAFGASSGLYIKKLVFSGMALTGFRMVIPILFLLPGIIAKKQLLGPRNIRKKLWLAGLLNAARMFLYILAFKYTTMGNAIVLLYLWPVFALIISSGIQKKRPDFLEFIIIIAAFTGVILMNLQRGFSLKQNDFMGMLFMITSSFLFAIATLIFKSTLKETSIAQTLYFQNAIGALIFLPFLIIAIPNATIPQFGLGIIYSVSIGIVAFGLFFYALKRMPVFQYSSLCYMEVVFDLMFSFLILNEQPAVNMLIGSGIIILASFLAQWKRNR